MNRKAFGMTLNQWLQWLGATLTAAFSSMIFIYSTFSTKGDTSQLTIRVDKVEERQEKSDEKIDRKLELINQKLDNLILNRSK